MEANGQTLRGALLPFIVRTRSLNPSLQQHKHTKSHQGRRGWQQHQHHQQGEEKTKGDWKNKERQEPHASDSRRVASS